MDTSRKETVQRGIVHLQQRFHICTENGKVISVLSIAGVFFSLLLYAGPLHFPSSARPAGCRHRGSSGYKNTNRSGIFIVCSCALDTSKKHL